MLYKVLHHLLIMEKSRRHAGLIFFLFLFGVPSRFWGLLVLQGFLLVPFRNYHKREMPFGVSEAILARLMDKGPQKRKEAAESLLCTDTTMSSCSLQKKPLFEDNLLPSLNELPRIPFDKHAEGSTAGRIANMPRRHLEVQVMTMTILMILYWIHWFLSRRRHWITPQRSTKQPGQTKGQTKKKVSWENKALYGRLTYQQSRGMTRLEVNQQFQNQHNDYEPAILSVQPESWFWEKYVLMHGRPMFWVADFSTARQIYVACEQSPTSLLSAGGQGSLRSATSFVLEQDWIPTRLHSFIRQGSSWHAVREMKMVAVKAIAKANLGYCLSHSEAEKLLALIDAFGVDGNENGAYAERITFGDPTKNEQVVTDSQGLILNQLCQVIATISEKDECKAVPPDSAKACRMTAMYLIQAVPTLSHTLAFVLHKLAENNQEQDFLRKSLIKSEGRERLSIKTVLGMDDEGESDDEDFFVQSIIQDSLHALLFRIPCQALANVIRETLRLQCQSHPTRHLIGENAIKIPAVLAGSVATVPANSTVIICHDLIQLNPRVYETPQAFMPKRWDYTTEVMMQSFRTLSLDPIRSRMMQDCAVFLEVALTKLIAGYFFCDPLAAADCHEKTPPDDFDKVLLDESALGKIRLSSCAMDEELPEYPNVQSTTTMYRTRELGQNYSDKGDDSEETIRCFSLFSRKAESAFAPM